MIYSYYKVRDHIRRVVIYLENLKPVYRQERGNIMKDYQKVNKLWAAVEREVLIDSGRNAHYCKEMIIEENRAYGLFGSYKDTGMNSGQMPYNYSSLQRVEVVFPPPTQDK